MQYLSCSRKFYLCCVDYWLNICPALQKKDENMKDDIRKLEHQLSNLKSDRKNLARNDARIRALQSRIDAANMIAGANANAKKRRR